MTKLIQTLAASLRHAAWTGTPAQIGGGKYNREECAAGAAALELYPAMLAALRKISQGADCFTFNSDADAFRFVDMVAEAVAPIISRIDGEPAPTAQPAAAIGEAGPAEGVPSRKKRREIPQNALGYRPLEFAALIGVGKTKAHEMIRSGEVESVLIGRTRIVKATSVRALIERSDKGGLSMVRYICTARYQTKAGNIGTARLEIEAPDIDEAREQAAARICARKSYAGMLDLSVSERAAP